MANARTFPLRIPRDVQVETYVVQLADGSIVTRTVEQLAPAPVSK